MSVVSNAIHTIFTCMYGPSHCDEQHAYQAVPIHEPPLHTKPNPTATYLTTQVGDTERNVYATQMPQVIHDAVNTHNALHPNTPPVTADTHGFDYDVVYMRGMEKFIQNAQKNGLKFPKEITTLSYKQNEQLKSVRSGMNSLNDADKKTGPKRAEINSRMANEKQLAIYSNMYHHAAKVLKTQSSELAGLLVYDEKNRSIVPSPDFLAAIQGGKSSIKTFLKNNTASLNIKALNGKSPRLENALGTYQHTQTLDPSDSNTNAYKEKILTNLLKEIFKQTPLLELTLALANQSVQEEATQQHSQSTADKPIPINGGSAFLEKTQHGFRLNQPYGQHNGKPCAYELVGEHNTYTLNRIHANGQKTNLGENPNLDTLKSYFFQADINDLFGQKNIALPKTTQFAQLAARLKTLAMVNTQIEKTLNTELKKETQAELEKRNIVSIQGTGFSYNAGLYGENQAVDSRTVMTSVLFDLAQEGKVALHGSCGFQQNAIWNMGGNITALQDTTGKTFLADPNHGNDPFTVEEKKSYQATKRFTGRAGMYEKKSADGQWAQRNYAPLSVTHSLNDGAETRSVPVRFKGQTVIGLQGYQQEFNIPLENLDDKQSNTLVTLSKQWDEGTHVDGNGKPITGANRSTISLRYNHAKRAYSIHEIKHWQAVPLADPDNPAQLLMDGDQVRVGYQEVIQQADDKGNGIDPSVLIDSTFDPINCVHTQNGLGAPHENEHLTGNLEIVGTSVLGNDKPHGRSTILAASKQNPLAHPVYVPSNTHRETLISEALEMRKGHLVVGTFNQHHTDMMKEEGGKKLNPYGIQNHGDHDHIHDEHKGNRQGNDSIAKTGLLLQNIQALTGEIEKRGTDLENGALLKPSTIKPTSTPTSAPTSRVDMNEHFQVWAGANKTLQKLVSIDSELQKALEEHVKQNPHSGLYTHTLDDKANVSIEWSTWGENAQATDSVNATQRIHITQLSYTFTDETNTAFTVSVDYKKEEASVSSRNTTVQITNPTLLAAMTGHVTDQMLSGRNPLPTKTASTSAEITANESTIVKQENDTFQTLVKQCLTHADQNTIEPHRPVDAVKPTRSISLKELFDQDKATKVSPPIEIKPEEMFHLQLKGTTPEQILNNLKTQAAEQHKTIPTETLQSLNAILKSKAWEAFTNAQHEAETAYGQLLALSQHTAHITKHLANSTTKTENELSDLQKNSDQRRFRGTGQGKDGWAQGAGLTAGIGGTGLTHSIYSALEQAGEIASTVGHIAAVTDSVLPFGVLLAAAGVEGFKNAAYATRRLKQVAHAYKEEHKACKTTIQHTKEELNAIQASLGKEYVTDSLLSQLKQTEQTLQNRINKIDQDLQQNLVTMVAAPMLPVAAAATLLGSAAKLAGATTASAIAGIVGGSALTVYGAIQTGNAIHVLRKSNQVHRAMSDSGYGVDSGIRRNFNIYHQQRRNALKFKIANWGTFTAGSAMLVAGSAATLTGVAAPVGLALGITGGLMMAGSVVTGVIDPKREWRGKTGMAGEDTFHLQGDFLSSGRRRNRLIHALNNQIGMWGKTMGNIVDHALTSNKPGMKHFTHRFNATKTLRWFSPNHHMRALARAMTAHPEEVKDHQFNLMLRTTLQEINFVNFKVDELKTEINKLKVGQAASKNTLSPALNKLIDTQLNKANAQLKKAEQQQADFGSLLNQLQTYEPEIGRKFRSNDGENTRDQFDRLRLNYMLAHDVLADGLRRRDIRKLVNQAGNTGHITAVIGNTTYTQGGQQKDPSGKVRAVSFQHGQETEDFLIQAMRNKHINPKLDIDRLFARVMCESLPARINYELAATYNSHMEDLRHTNRTRAASQ